ncbi:MAG: bacterioferritin-associated ferredoxin [Candidatus Competibacter sp.]|jgi:bacterioferritin-associated ferredoxin|nr:bacterioferritin-associated ferredoxin [Candidatus Competibacter sp.]
MFLCICKSISDTQIREAVDQGARTIGDISARFGVGVECGKCLDDVRQFLDACLLAPPSAQPSTPPSTPTAVEVTPPRAAKPAPQQAAWFAVDL